MVSRTGGFWPPLSKTSTCSSPLTRASGSSRTSRALQSRRRARGAEQRHRRSSFADSACPFPSSAIAPRAIGAHLCGRSELSAGSACACGIGSTSRRVSKDRHCGSGRLQTGQIPSTVSPGAGGHPERIQPVRHNRDPHRPSGRGQLRGWDRREFAGCKRAREWVDAGGSDCRSAAGVATRRPTDAWRRADSKHSATA